MRAGRNQTFANIKNTVLLFNSNGYSNGLQIAKYLKKFKDITKLVFLLI